MDENLSSIQARISAKLRVLVLGDRWSAAHKSQQEIYAIFKKTIFKSEHSFKDVDHCMNFLGKHAIDLIILPNPYGNDRRLSIYSRCKHEGMPLIVFDRGGLPNSWFFDTGFNADSETYLQRKWDVELTNRQKLKVNEYIEDLKKSDIALELQGDRIGGELLRKKLGLDEAKILFVPFQRPQDTTIKYFSGNVPDLCSFTREIENLQTILEHRNWRIICKKHPLEMDKPSELLRFVPEDTHISDLLEMCDAVSLINSGVGLLATLYEKPVFHFGHTYYSHPSLNRMVRSADEILIGLSSVPIDFSITTRDRLIHYLIDSVYSFGKFETQVVKDGDQSLRNVTKRIEFSEVRMPIKRQFEKKKSCRILFLTPVIPYPINRGSAQRTCQVLHAMEDLGYSVDIAILNRSESVTQSKDIVVRLKNKFPRSSIYVRRHPMFLKRSKINSDRFYYIVYLFDRLLDFINLSNWKITNRFECPRNFETLVKKLVKSGRYDLIYCNYLKITPSYLNKNQIFSVADLHDIQSNRILNDVVSTWPRYVRGMLFRIFKKSEKKLLNRFDSLVAITDVEKNQLEQDFLIKKRINVLPVTFFPVTHVSKGQFDFDLLFVGSNSGANFASIKWFLVNVWPLLTVEKPEITLVICGNICRNRELNNIINDKPIKYENVYLKGYFNELGSMYDTSKIVISPTVYGTGMKVKVIEALSYGKVVVGTAIAFDGIHVTHRLNAHVCDNKTDFKNSICELIDHETKADKISDNARIFFENEHCFSNAKKVLFDIVSSRF